MVYTANWGIIWYLPPIKGTRNNHWPHVSSGHELDQLSFDFFFLHILNGRMATLPQALPRSFRDLHFCFRESKFKTAASASFRGVDFFRIFLEVLPRSHGELPRKLYLGVAWKCVYLYFRMGEHGWTIFHDPIFHTDGLGVFQCLRVKGLLPQSFCEASAKNMNTFTKNILRPLPACVYHGSCKTITSYKAQYMSIYDIFICCS